MRRVLTISLAALLCASPACKKADPYAVSSHLEALAEDDGRGPAISALDAIVKSFSIDQVDPRRAEIVEKVYPLFLQHWEASGVYQLSMLEIARTVADPGAAELWKRGLELDGTAEGGKRAIVSLQGIRAANATAMAPELAQKFAELTKSPSKDPDGSIRLEYAKTLGALGDASAVDPLIASLLQDKEKQPVGVHKAAVDALGKIGDPKAAPALASVQFRVPDSPGTQSISERAKRAMAAIGTPAVDAATKMFRGELDDVNQLAAQHGISDHQVKLAAADILGAIGSEAAVEDLIAFLPKDGCEGAAPASRGKKKRRRQAKKAEPTEANPEAVQLRAMIARALGYIGDERAVPALCACRNATHNPGDLWEITSALGRIGGPKAFDCLGDIVAENAYDAEVVTDPVGRFEIRWEGARFMTLAAPPSRAPDLRKAFQQQKHPEVKKRMERWLPAVDLVEKCKEDTACYMTALNDLQAPEIVREKAAVEVARLAKGDKAAALAVSKAFKVRDADSRITMALLASRMMAGDKCPDCADALQQVLSAEKGNAAPQMQLAWMTARQAMAKLGGDSEVE